MCSISYTSIVQPFSIDSFNLSAFCLTHTKMELGSSFRFYFNPFMMFRYNKCWYVYVHADLVRGLQPLQNLQNAKWFCKNSDVMQINILHVQFIDIRQYFTTKAKMVNYRTICVPMDSVSVQSDIAMHNPTFLVILLTMISVCETYQKCKRENVTFRFIFDTWTHYLQKWIVEKKIILFHIS